MKSSYRNLLKLLGLTALAFLPSLAGSFYCAVNPEFFWVSRLLAAAGSAVLTGILPNGLRGVWFAGYLFFALLEFASLLLTGRMFGYEFWFHFSKSGLSSGVSEYAWPLAGAAFYWLGAGAAAQFCGDLRGGLRFLPLGVILLLFPSPISTAAQQYWTFFHAPGQPGTGENPVRDNGMIDSQIIARPGKNLLLIYLESTERAYLDESLYPGLLPNLRELQKEAVDFSDVGQTDRAHFTFGSLYASQTGAELVNLQLPRSHNDGLNPTVGNRMGTMPGILKKAGYFNSFMQSTTLAFGGTNVLLNFLKYDDMWAAQALAPEVRKQLGLHGEWGGCRDRKLFDFAYRKLQILHQRKQPFLLTLMTIDGHHPAGFTDAETIEYNGKGKRSTLLNALHTTDRALGDFIRALKQSELWEHLTVIIVSDHLSMPAAETYPLLKTVPDRKLLFLALNAGSPRTIREPGRTFDLAPTILALAGVAHNWTFPLGENLLAGTHAASRLTADRPEKLPFLESYLKRKSAVIPAGAKAELSADPYWSIRIGDFHVPLFARYGEQRPLKPGEVFVIRISPDNLIADARGFEENDPELAEIYRKDAREFWELRGRELRKITPDKK